MFGIARLLYLVLTIYAWLILARVVLSWLDLRPGGAAGRGYRLLFDVTEPYLALFRRVLPTVRIGSVGVDFSSVLALAVLFIAMQLVGRL
jgi:YggT family protein